MKCLQGVVKATPASPSTAYHRHRPFCDAAMPNEIATLQTALREFARERDWEQFHSPKNLAAALSVEAAELLEIFQWLTEAQSSSLSEQQSAAAQEELADVFLYMLRLADRLGIDLIEAAHRKIALNAKKYPADRARGRADKYTEL